MFFGHANQDVLSPPVSALDELNTQPIPTPIFSPLQNIIAYASISENPVSEVGLWGSQVTLPAEYYATVQWFPISGS